MGVFGTWVTDLGAGSRLNRPALRATAAVCGAGWDTGTGAGFTGGGDTATGVNTPGLRIVAKPRSRTTRSSIASRPSRALDDLRIVDVGFWANRFRSHARMAHSDSGWCWV